MADEVVKQEKQKSLVAFIAGLLIGGLLVWVLFDNPDKRESKNYDEKEDAATESEQTDSEVQNEVKTDAEVSLPTTTLPTGEGKIEVEDQNAGRSVAIQGATFPNDEGWIGVRAYQNDQLGSILGAARFSKEQGLVPDSIPLLVPTVAGNTYAVVFFTEDGNRTFNLSGDVQVEGIWKTFTAK